MLFGLYLAIYAGTINIPRVGMRIIAIICINSRICLQYALTASFLQPIGDLYDSLPLY